MSKYSRSLIEDHVVISGMSGRFPESDSTDELAHNLYQNKDLITEDDRRWPKQILNMNSRMGKLKSIDKFDGKFFGSISQYGDNIDPQSRILLETTYEAIIDAGINPQSLRGTKTGVYIGFTTFGYQDGERDIFQPDTESYQGEESFSVQGEAKCLYANRISYAFDFKGPSLIMDTACSSSLVALDYAFKDMILGECDQAIVGGAQLCLQPSFNHIFQWSGGNAMDGIPKVWDEKADGYVRGETIGCLLLQRRSESKRIYATVLNTGVNIDGYKTKGLNFPSSEMQEKLMVQVYKGARVDPVQVTYIEAHATGTAAGDSVEAEAIFKAYAFGISRKSEILIGLSKSMMGHTEGAAGTASIIKLLLAFENECIPANIHLNQIKSSIKQYCPPLLPTRENIAYVPGIAGVNNFGIGGVNANALLEPNDKTTNEDNLRIAETFPRIVNLCCRTEEAFNEMCDWIENNPKRVSRHFLALLAETVRLDSSLSSSGFPFRGSVLIKQLAENSFEYQRQYSLYERKTRRPVWFVFSGIGGQWVGMGKALMSIDIFADKIEECHQILVPYGINLKYLLISEDKDTMSTTANKYCATTSLEMALYEVMKSLNIISDGVIGHSFGEIAAAYAVGCLNTEEALLVSYFRGVITGSDENLPNGLMAVVGLSWSEMKKRCPEGVEVVCNNGKQTVVVSGLRNCVEDLIRILSEQGVFVRALDNNNVPFHSSYMSSTGLILNEKLREILKKPKLRPRHWISTAFEYTDRPMKEELKYASAEYFVHNLVSPVYFYDNLPKIPDDSIVIEVGPHPLFAKSIKETIGSVDYISLMKKNSNDTNLETFLSSIGRLYELGLNPIIEKMYPKVEWPVARGTQSISSLMRWQHCDSYHVKKYPEHFCKATGSDMDCVIDIKKNFHKFLCDHCVDGTVIYPATGYLMLAWRQLANFHSKPWNTLPVIFEDLQFRRRIFLYENQNVKITTRYFPESGSFVVSDGSEISCVGKIRTPDDNCLHFQHLLIENNENNNNVFEVVLNTKDIYKHLKVRGYDYGIKFQKLLSLKTNDFQEHYGEVEWDGNWVTFVDSLLQSAIMGQPSRKLMIPVMIKYLRCDPQILSRAVRMNKIKDIDSIKNEREHFIGELTNNEKLNEKLKQTYNLFASTLNYYTNNKLKLVVAPGLEVEGMLAQTIQRKIQGKGLTLESYKFIENEESKDENSEENEELNEYLIRSLLDIVSENNVPKKQIKVFEINLTDDQSVEEVRNYLSFTTLYRIDVKHTIALKSIEAIPEEYRKAFKLIEWKPSPSSVFPSEVISTDLVVCNVSEELMKISFKEHLQKIFDVLVDRGFLLCLFNQIQQKTNDFHKFEPIVEKFVNIAESLGFILIGRKSKFDSISLLWRKVVIKDLIPKCEDVIYITNQINEWFEPLKEKMRQVKQSEDRIKFWLISNGSKINGVLGLVNCLRLEAGGEGIRCLFNCDTESNPVNLESDIFSDILKKDLAINVVKDGKLGTYRHLCLPSNWDKIQSKQYFLNISENKDISGLRWYDMSQSVPSESPFNEINRRIRRIECDIYMTGINFKDVMISSGRVKVSEESLLLESQIGMEFVGRSKMSGGRVIGLTFGGSFATHISVNDSLITEIPDHWSMEEAVTIPITYSTVWLGLIKRAQMRTNEKVLIHSGTGGVGQAAITVCQYYNCDIFVTVGNNKKKEFLMKTYGIPDNRIFSSRDIQFKYEIMKLTEGKGVDIVLNSLTGDKMDASVDCLAKSGRFVEFGKYELQMNKQLGMYFLLKDISFLAVELGLKMEDLSTVEEFFQWMHKNSTNGMIKPINTTVFSAEETEKAFRYMTTGKHIGKIVIKIRDEENQKELNNNFNSPKDMIVSTKTFFHPKKVYIITGGLGGMALELVHWMLSLGARNFVLTSRSGVKTEYQKFVLDRLKRFGENNKYFESNINVSTVDTNTIEGAKKLISDSRFMGEIGGIFHLALVLNDSLFENQTFESFSETVDIKAKQFQNLDEISRQLKLNLDFFVVFSSVSCGKGNGGQTNYGYGNSVCERICEVRRKDGLHGLAIQWGPIGDVGVIADEDMSSSLTTVVKQRINSCFEALDKLLQTNESIVSCVIKVESNSFSNTMETKSSKLQILWQMLGTDPKNTPAHFTLEQLGMNSLFMADFQQTMQRDFGLKLSQNEIKSITLGMLRDMEAGNVDQIKKLAQFGKNKTIAF